MTHAPRRPLPLLPALALLAALAPTSAATAQNGTIVEGPRNIAAFRPRDAAYEDLDGRTVDLRDVFEDLGEDATLWYQHVQTLANPFFEGRVPGSHGQELTAQYIEFYFRMYGLEPAFPENEGDAQWTSYRQSFEFRTRGRLSAAKVLESRFALDGRDAKHEKDFMVLGNSGSGSVDAPVTFVGYAIRQGQDGYTSFDEHTDLDGRIALMFRYEPLDEEGRSQWNPRRFSGHASITSKMEALEEHGASAILMVNPPGAEQGRTGLEDLEYSSRFGRSISIPAIQVSPEIAARILAETGGGPADLIARRRRADLGQVRTVDLPDRRRVALTATVERVDSSRAVAGHNMGGVLRGRGDLADEWLVIGGHHDHIGTGGLGGNSPGNRGQLHPGADDNASGTAGVLMMARKLTRAYAESDEEDLRSVLLMTFDAEETGLHGSRHYADHPTLDPHRITAMINMDMIGRLRGGNLSVLGTGTAQHLEDILPPHFEHSGLTVAVTPGASGRSDDVNFIRLEVPAVFMFTGMHDEYHAPGDQAWKVNPFGAEQVLELVEDISLDLVTRNDRLVFATPGRTEGQNRGYAPVRLGIRPDMAGAQAKDQPGIPVAQVSSGTSADEGGMLDGDVMIAWDGEDLNAMGDLMEHLRAHKPGDRVMITVLREGQRVDLDVTLKGSE